MTKTTKCDACNNTGIEEKDGRVVRCFCGRDVDIVSIINQKNDWNDWYEIRSRAHWSSCKEAVKLKTSCHFCEKRFEGLEQLAWHLNVECREFDEIVNGLSDD